MQDDYSLGHPTLTDSIAPQEGAICMDPNDTTHFGSPQYKLSGGCWN